MKFPYMPRFLHEPSLEPASHECLNHLNSIRSSLEGLGLLLASLLAEAIGLIPVLDGGCSWRPVHRSLEEGRTIASPRCLAGPGAGAAH
jgi:hypothetical protein